MNVAFFHMFMTFMTFIQPAFFEGSAAQHKNSFDWLPPNEQNRLLETGRLTPAKHLDLA